MGHELVSRPTRLLAGSLLGLGLLAAPVTATLAAEVSLGAAMRSSFTVTDPDGGDSSSSFALNSVWVYLNGKVTDDIGFSLNTAYSTYSDDVSVLDAFATYAPSEKFNLWAGRFLAPSDRANMYGPYFASNWAFAVDGVQDPYPFEVGGRDDGVMYWGQFGVAKVSAGVFNNTTGTSDLKYAGRVQFDLWDPEGGYYLNGSYYGAKDLLAIGVSAQGASGDSAVMLDVLMEKKLANAGVLTLEAEYGKYDGYAGYVGFPATEADGYFGLAAYMFPQQVGPGKFQILGKYGTVSPDGGGADIDTLELNLNYIIKDQNARAHLFYVDQDFAGKVYGLGLQLRL